MKYGVIIGFVIMVLAQWYAPISMIIGSEKTIDGGKEFKFRTRPVDPSDPFRGKSIILQFDATTYTTNDSTQLKFLPSSPVYAVIDVDPRGFARIKQLTNDPPEDRDFFTAQFNYSYDSIAYLSFPFDEFYLEESKASEAERIYWQSRSDSTMVCYAKVMVLDGDAKLVDVIVNDSSIVDVVKRINVGKED